MEMKEIDPKLFVTCRLCLEDTGVYQIRPDIQKQIKYCFDIDVDPYDGLPQLLCKKCETLLSDYYRTKETFLAKQESLKLRNTDPSPSPEDVHGKNKTLKRKRIISSSSDSDTGNCFKKVRNELHSSLVVSHVDTSSAEENTDTWKTAYSRLFICKLCNDSFRRKNAWESHFRSHAYLQTKYSSILTNRCTVNLNRVDDKPNMTGDLKKVVYSSDKVIKQCQGNYYLIYTMNERVCPQSYLKGNNRTTIYSSSESSDREDNGKKSRSRRRSLSSRSSLETMVLDDARSYLSDTSDNLKLKSDKTIPNGVVDCINIDDSSESDDPQLNKSLTTSDTNINVTERNQPTEVADEEAIRNIISQCQNKYLQTSTMISNKHNKSLKEQLKHKVLSVGKKILTKRNFNSTGILRYLEFNDLKVEWIPKTNRKLSYIHAKTEPQTSNKGDWIKVVSNVPRNELNQDYQGDTQPKANSIPLATSHSSLPDVVIENTFPYKDVTTNVQQCPDSAILYLDTNSSDSKNKLLNENPVANPKQLPKKLITKKHSTQCSSPDASKNITSCNNSADIDCTDDANVCMPIITSTKSLAETNAPDTIAGENSSHKDEPTSVTSSVVTAPRIKVKPVSELMSESVLQNLKLHEANMNMNQLQQNVPSKLGDTSNGSTSNSAPDQPTGNKDYVILDTVEIPNMKTNSPFRYLRTLLNFHNIILLDIKHPISSDFVCLIKFKVFYNQEAKQQPVVICLSLFNYKNSFCIKIKDKQQEYINVDGISPNWQWELLKLYKGDVVNKILQNAMKVSQGTFNYTQSFLCLLKSINMKSDS